MNRYEKDIIRKLIDSTAGVYRPTSLDAQIQAWTDLRGALTAAVALVEQPDTDSDADVQFTAAYYLEFWDDIDRYWYAVFAQYDGDTVREEALSMLESNTDVKRRVVRIDAVTTTVVLGERDAEPGDA